MQTLRKKKRNTAVVKQHINIHPSIINQAEAALESIPATITVVINHRKETIGDTSPKAGANEVTPKIDERTTVNSNRNHQGGESQMTILATKFLRLLI